MILQWAGSRFGYVAAVHCISLLAAHLGKIHTLLNGLLTKDHVDAEKNLSDSVIIPLFEFIVKRRKYTIFHLTTI